MSVFIQSLDHLSVQVQSPIDGGNDQVLRAIATSGCWNSEGASIGEVRGNESVVYAGLGNIQTGIAFQARRINLNVGGTVNLWTAFCADAPQGPLAGLDVPFWDAGTAGNSIFGGKVSMGDRNAVNQSLATLEIHAKDPATGYAPLYLYIDSPEVGHYLKWIDPGEHGENLHAGMKIAVFSLE